MKPTDSKHSECLDTNPYAAPTAPLEMPAETAASYYVVGLRKFTLLFFFTLGLYAIYWFYQNWALQKRRYKENIWPVPRSIFNIFFTHSLFRRVRGELDKQQLGYRWSADLAATAYVLISLLSNGLERMSARGVGSPYTDLLSLLLLPALYFPLRSAQKAINLLEQDSDGARNATLTPANYAWILIGAIWWVVVAFGMALVLGLVDV